MRAKILIADEEPMLTEAIAYILHGAGYVTLRAEDGEDVLEVASAQQPHLILLSATLTKTMSGQVCCALRQDPAIPPSTSILMWGSGASEKGRVAALNCGVDDYLVKPFGIGELLARVHNLLRHSSASLSVMGGAELQAGRIRLHTARREVFVEDGSQTRAVTLTRKEFDLLHLLLSQRSHVVSNETILERIWGRSNAEGRLGKDATMAVHIMRLRKKLEKDPAHPRHIILVHGNGYRFKE